MSDPNPLLPGQIEFLDNGVPVLTAGSYKITVNHQVTEPSFSIDSSYGASEYLMVQAPRFSLPVGTVSSRFPAEGTQSDYHAYMPFIVMKGKHLAWNRDIGSDPNGNPCPWMALMVFKQTDLVYTPPTPPQQADPTMSTIRPIADVVNYNTNNTIGPNISLDGNEQSLQVNTIDIAGSTFLSLAPAFNDLPFLAHLRQINTGGQTMDGMNGNGFYSVVLANRLADRTTQTSYVVHLVSLEGWEGYLQGTSTFAANQVARLVSLDSWTFISDPAGADFKALIDGLDVQPVQLPFNPPASWGTTLTPAQTEVKNRYSNGYVALNGNTRLGNNSFAWYRGPFSPNVPSMITNIDPKNAQPLVTADQALIYDPVNGVFDKSYAVAWEMGRLLTLANGPIALAIWKWKKTGMSVLQLLDTLATQPQQQTQPSMLAARQPAGRVLKSGAPNWKTIRNNMLNPNAGNQAFMNYLGSSLGKHITKSNVVQVRNPSKLTKHFDKMPGLLKPDELEKVLREGKDPHAYIAEKLTKKKKK